MMHRDHVDKLHSVLSSTPIQAASDDDRDGLACSIRAQVVRDHAVTISAGRDAGSVLKLLSYSALAPRVFERTEHAAFAALVEQARSSIRAGSARVPIRYHLKPSGARSSRIHRRGFGAHAANRARATNTFRSMDANIPSIETLSLARLLIVSCSDRR